MSTTKDGEKLNIPQFYKEKLLIAMKLFQCFFDYYRVSSLSGNNVTTAIGLLYRCCSESTNEEERDNARMELAAAGIHYIPYHKEADDGLVWIDTKHPGVCYFFNQIGHPNWVCEFAIIPDYIYRAADYYEIGPCKSNYIGFPGCNIVDINRGITVQAEDNINEVLSTVDNNEKVINPFLLT